MEMIMTECELPTQHKLPTTNRRSISCGMTTPTSHCDCPVIMELLGDPGFHRNQAPGPFGRRVKVGGNLSATMNYLKVAVGITCQSVFARLSNSHAFCGTVSSGDPVYDLVIVGGGIVGLATARETAMRHPNMQIAVVEKENKLAWHQSGLNSGVMHMGLYYKPGSLKARLCVQGGEMMYAYLEEKGIPFRKCGKVVVAVDEEEVPSLKKIYETACVNKCKDIRLISGEELKKIEPHCKGVMAIHSPNTGVVDFGKVAQSFGKDFKDKGGTIFTGFQVDGFTLAGDNQDEVHIESSEGKVLRSHHVITCCGLHSDRVARLSGCKHEPRIVPIRGEYLVLNKNKSHLVNGNIYPVPNPKVPFLGVHFTPRMDGAVWCGPNATLAFSKDKFSSVTWQDLKEMLTYKGFRQLVMKQWRFGSKAFYRGVIMRAQLKQLQRYVPDITMADLSRGPSGVVGQAVDVEGNFLQDFVFDQGEGDMGRRMLHVRNAPSPAATSSMAIAKMIADKALQTFDWDVCK